MSIESELLALKDKNGLIQPERVVAWALKHRDSAIYNAPEFLGWKEDKQAEAYRLWVARKLIAIHVVYETGQRRLVSLSLDRTRPGGGYRDVDDVLRDRSLYDIMLNDALTELDRMQAKYDRLLELKPIWRERDAIRSSKSKKKEKQVA